MDGWQLFIRHHAGTHSAEVSEAKGVRGDAPFEDLSDDQVRLRPHGLNSIAWLIWHIARCEDITVNPILMGRPQVLDENDWSRRLNVSRRDLGTDMTPEEVAELSASVDIQNLRAYRIAVGKRTRATLQSLPNVEWGDVVEAERVRQAVAQGALGPNAGWVEELWATGTKAWFLHYEVVAHNWLHLGQALWVRKLVMTEPS